MKMRMWTIAAVVAWAVMAGVASAATPPAVSEPATSPESNPDSKRMERAKEYFADEQWVHAIAAFQVVVNDPREANRDEALFWLAQSEHETGDHPAAIQTLARLEREFPKSPWVRFGRSLRVEIAQRLNRDDVLWAVVAPAAPVPPATLVPPRPPAGPATPMAAPPPPTPPTRRVPMVWPSPPAAAPATPAVTAPPAPPAPTPTATPMPSLPPTAVVPPGPRPPRPARPVAVPPTALAAPAALLPGAEYFLPTPFPPDTDLRIEALFGLLDSHGDRAVPLLREIALDGNNPDEARRALIVLARSPRSDARTTVQEVARRGPEPVRVAAIREMGRFTGANVGAELMQVYASASTPRVKRQVVSSLGERGDNVALLRIAGDESDAAVRNVAIMTLGRLPDARPQLRTLYARARPESRFAVLSALLTSKDEDELIRIAGSEKDPLLRQRARMQLRLLATPKALRFLEEHP
jgi:hypothetical protein